MSKGILRNNRGQGLVEYLIIVALMAIATMAILRLMNNTVQTQFARITRVLQGHRPENINYESVKEEDYKKRDMSDFFNGAN